jgi:hypothetical protein
MVYLLHFGEKHHHAQHYLGYTENLEERLRQHVSGQGSGLIKVVVNRGIGLSLARVWFSDGHYERWLHKKKNNPQLCPICRCSNVNRR